MTAYREVIEAECDREDCRNVMTLLTNREMNMVGGRPSDCARSAARDHRAMRNRYGADGCGKFVADFVPASQMWNGRG